MNMLNGCMRVCRTGYDLGGENLAWCWHGIIVVKRLECIKNHEEIEDIVISYRIRVFRIRIRLVDFCQLIDQKSTVDQNQYRPKACNFVQSFVIYFFFDVMLFLVMKMASFWMNVTCFSINNALFPKLSNWSCEFEWPYLECMNQPIINSNY